MIHSQLGRPAALAGPHYSSSDGSAQGRCRRAPSPCVSGRLHCMVSRFSTSSSPSGRRITSSPPKMNSLLPTRQPCGGGSAVAARHDSAQRPRSPCWRAYRLPGPQSALVAAVPCLPRCRRANPCSRVVLARPRTEWPPRGLGKSSPSSAVHSMVLQVPALTSNSRTGISGSDSLACREWQQHRGHRPTATCPIAQVHKGPSSMQFDLRISCPAHT